MQTKIKIPFWASILTLLGVIVLCALGTWQLERLEWKEQIIADLDAAYESDAAAWLTLDQNFTYGRIAGDFLADKALFIGPKTRDGEVGRDLVVPIVTDEGQSLLVNMGWTAEKDIQALPISHAKGDRVYFTGLLRAPTWNSFTPNNIPAKDVWYKADTAQIAATKGLDNIVPFVLYAEKSSYDFYGEFPNNQRQYPNNNHLQYAFFWFTMAGALIVIYILRFIKSD